MITVTHPAAKAVVAAVHKAATAVLRKVAPNAPVRPYGMHPLAWQTYLAAGLSPSRVGQTIGSALASAGTHAKDGEYMGHDYAADTDYRIGDLTTDAEVRAFLTKLWSMGLGAYYRANGQDHWPGVRHVHGFFPGCPMKEICRHQVHDFLHNPMENGLASHADYHFAQPTEAQCQPIRAAFLAHNPMNN